MSLFTVDNQKCERCGTCAAVCPMGIIIWQGRESLPEPVDGAARLCINCGHCLAVCPRGALSLAAMPVDDCRLIDRNLLPSFAQFSEAVHSRRSTRVYKEESVARQDIEKLIEVARHAPTGKNTQLLNWLVIQGRQRLEPLVEHCIDWMRDMVAKKHPMAAAFGMGKVIAARQAGMDPILRGAPALVIMHAAQEYTGGTTDSTIALTTLDLAAPRLGLGTCWAGFFQIAATMWQPLQQALKLPPGHLATGAMMLGHPKFRYQRVVQRKPASVTWR